jgi:hypothetical protein
MGILIEGRQSGNQRRKMNSRVYHRLENVQDAMPSLN